MRCPCQDDLLTSLDHSIVTEEQCYSEAENKGDPDRDMERVSGNNRLIVLQRWIDTEPVWAGILVEGNTICRAVSDLAVFQLTIAHSAFKPSVVQVADAFSIDLFTLHGIRETTELIALIFNHDCVALIVCVQYILHVNAPIECSNQDSDDFSILTTEYPLLFVSKMPTM